MQNPGLYFLASVLSAYPEEEVFKNLAELRTIFGVETEEPGLAAVFSQGALFPDLDQLRSDYIDIFDRGQAQNPIYETEFGRNRSISKTRELADLVGFYKAFGLEREGQADLPDHIAVELEFYGYLLLKEAHLEKLGDQQGVEIVGQARCRFLKDHLGGFAQVLPDSPLVQAHPFYGAVFRWIRFLVAEACTMNQVEAAPLQFFSQEMEPEELNCSLGGCSLTALRASKT